MFWNWRALIERRKFNREFKLEAVRLVREQGVGVTQAARDLDLHVNVLGKWVRERFADPQQTFPYHGQMSARAAGAPRRSAGISSLAGPSPRIGQHHAV